jgi:hypothetical protein
VSLWRLLEAYHAILYFAPERTPHYKALGVKGGWMGYFATRSSPLGQVPTEVVTALFYNFKHSMVNRALPDAWRYTTPEKAYEARLRIFDQSITRLLGSELLTSPGHARAAELAIRAAQACPLPGRPLAAAYLAQPVPHETQLRLFWAATVLREYRGDGHIAALSSAGIDGCEANVLLSALGLVPPEQQQYRGWTDEDWAGGIRRLAERGWVTPKGNITKVGAQERAAVERLTDTLAAAPLLSVGDELVAELVELLTPLAARIVTAGGVPYPNGIGLPPAADAYSAS